MRHPPLLPSEVLRRVMRVARFDGMSVLAVAGAFALASAMLHDEQGTVIGLLIAGAGAIELHGVSLLRQGDEHGTRWLVSSQCSLLVVILGYVALRLSHVDITLLQPLLTDEQKRVILQRGLTIDEFLRAVYVMGYGIIAIATVIYQGGMAIYYLLRRTAVAAALRESE
jgi:hypothetical protein